jgi:hypothetical protein
MSKMNTVSGKTTWVEGHPYLIGEDEYGNTTLTPEQGRGDEAASNIGWDDYGYTHGGRVFRAAVDRAYTIAEMKRKQAEPKKVCECCGQAL